MRNPVTGEELSAAWLTDALGPRTGGARVDAVGVEELASPDSLFSEPVRLHLTWRDAGPDLPTTLFAKAVSPGDRAATLGASLGVFDREAAFYGQLAERCGVGCPRAWFVWATGDATLLILDDLSSLRTGDGVTGIDIDDARRVLEALAAMHASWWDEPVLTEHPWLRRDDAEAVESMDRAARELLPRFVDRCGQDLSAAELDLLEEVAGSASTWREPLFHTPHATLIHGDVKPGNLFFAPEGVTFIDWQAVKVGTPALDVASLLGSGLAGADRVSTTAPLLAAYEHSLGALGVTLDAERWRDELRRAAHAMVLPCLASAEVATDDFAATVAVTARRRLALALSLRQN